MLAHGPRPPRVPRAWGEDEHSVSGECGQRLEVPGRRDNYVLLEQTPSLFRLPPRKDRATKLLTYLADTIVNVNPEVKGKPVPKDLRPAPVPEHIASAPPPGT